MSRARIVHLPVHNLPLLAHSFLRHNLPKTLGSGLPQHHKDPKREDRQQCNCFSNVEGTRLDSQSLHKLKVIIVSGMAGVRISLLYSNDLVFLLDQLLRRLGLEFLHGLC